MPRGAPVHTRTDRVADGARVQQGAGRLDAGAEHGIGSAADHEARGIRGLEHAPAASHIERERLLAVHVLARRERLQRDVDVRGWDGQVEHEVDVVGLHAAHRR